MGAVYALGRQAGVPKLALSTSENWKGEKKGQAMGQEWDLGPVLPALPCSREEFHRVSKSANPSG